jgi:hypothetical protein
MQDKLDTPQQIDNLWRIAESIAEWIRFSDTKAGGVLAVCGVVLTVVFTNPDKIIAAVTCDWLIRSIFILTSLSLIASVICSFLCLNPRLNNKNPTSIIYFGHIQERFMSFETYNDETTVYFNDIEKLKRQLSAQIYTNSKIAWSKFRLVSISIRFFCAFSFFLG